MPSTMLEAFGIWLYMSMVFILIIASVYCVFYLYQHIQLRYLTDMKQYANKTVVLTGATSGIGQKMAIELYHSGAQLILIGRNIDALNTLIYKQLLPLTANTVLSSPPTPIPIVADLSLPELSSVSPPTTPTHPTQQTLNTSITSHRSPTATFSPLNPYDESGDPITLVHVVDAIQRIAPGGKIDSIICCAGVSMRDRVKDVRGSTERAIFNINYFSHNILCRLLLQRDVLLDYGRIVVVSSLQGLLSIPFRSSYSASKYAVQAYFTSLRHELACEGSNIAVTIVSPGYVNTNLSSNALVGSGAKYSKVDETTAAGLAPDYVAHMTLAASLNKVQELWLCPPHHKFLALIQYICPSLTNLILQKRGRKVWKQMKE